MGRKFYQKANIVRASTLTANAAVTFTQNAASTSTTSGTLVVTGGTGVSGKLFTGDTISATNGSLGIVGYAIATGAASISDFDRYYLVISTSSFTLTLPATSTNGRTLVFGDGANFSSFPITLARNGATIAGLAENLILDQLGSRVEMVYYNGDWKVFVS